MLRLLVSQTENLSFDKTRLFFQYFCLFPWNYNKTKEQVF